MADLPAGFVLDKPATALPPGFVLDGAQNRDLYSTNPAEGMSGTAKFLSGAGKAMTDIGRGAGQLLREGIETIAPPEQTISGLVSGQRPSSFADTLGLPTQQDIDLSKQRDAPLMETGAGTAGNITGAVATALPAMLIPGANSVAGAATLGTIQGALMPTATGESRTQNMAFGGVGGAGGQLAAKGLSRALNPQTIASVKKIIDAGVVPTPGQILGGAWAKLESAAQSIPFVGQGIKNAKTRAIHQFNNAVINKALAPIGETVKDVGHEGMIRARDAVGKAYDTAIDLVPIVDFGTKVPPTALAVPGQLAPANTFWSTIDNIKNMGQTLKPEYSKQLDSIIEKELVNKITPAGTLSGESAKTVQSEIARTARDFRRGNPSRDDLQIANALDAVSDAIKGQVAQANPVAAEMIKRADAAHAMLLRVERAAQGQGAPDGIFTPAQFGNAVKAMDTSLRKTAVGQGRALMQDMSTAGREVLGDSLPNSGTADRIMSAGAIGSLGTGALLAHPLPLMGALAARGAYTDPAQKVLASLLTQRSGGMRAAGDLVRLGAPAAGLTGIQGLLNVDE